MIRLVLFISLLLMTGCLRTRTASPREQFLQTVSDRAAYAKVYEVSPESLREQEERLFSLVKRIVQNVREVNRTTTNNPSLDQGLIRIERKTEGLYQERLKLIESLEQHYNQKTDAILFFHFWPNDEKQQVGYVIIRSGVPIYTELLW
jgi:hypothetical protein